jgi:hypothetical protein
MTGVRMTIMIAQISPVWDVGTNLAAIRSAVDQARPGEVTPAYHGGSSLRRA